MLEVKEIHYPNYIIYFDLDREIAEDEMTKLASIPASSYTTTKCIPNGFLGVKSDYISLSEFSIQYLNLNRPEYCKKKWINI